MYCHLPLLYFHFLSYVTNHSNTLNAYSFVCVALKWVMWFRMHVADCVNYIIDLIPFPLF